jgi:uroporphyrinogen decarboxylase
VHQYGLCVKLVDTCQVLTTLTPSPASHTEPPPEFRKLREKHDFFEICQTPELAKEITLQPIDRYPDLIDAAIIFSDILVIPQALGMEVLMNPGPFFTKPLEVPDDVKGLQTDGVKERLQYVYDAIRLTRTQLLGRVPLIGFCGSPWTLMSYMIEGGASKTLQKSKTWLFKYPVQSKALLELLTTACIDFLVGQVEAGAQVCPPFSLRGTPTLNWLLNVPASPSFRFQRW